MNVLVTGATGMVGKGVLLECLEHPSVTKVLTIGRRRLDLVHSKLTQLVHKDFSEFETVSKSIEGIDACFHCMGVSAAGLSENEYTKFTHTYTMALAKVFLEVNPKSTFCYVSGQGTDSKEKSRQMWARVKGKTENDIQSLGFKKAFMFRPGAIIPEKGIMPSSKLYRVLIQNLEWFLRLLKKIFPNAIVNTTQVGKAMIAAHLRGYHSSILTPKDIQILAHQLDDYEN